MVKKIVQSEREVLIQSLGGAVGYLAKKTSAEPVGSLGRMNMARLKGTVEFVIRALEALKD